MSTRSIRDVTRALQTQFSAAKIPLALPVESRRMLQAFVDEHEGRISEEESSRANLELRNFWERFVGENPSKTGAFVGVLRELRPALLLEADIAEWWQLVVKPVVTGIGYRKSVQDDALEFVVGCMEAGGDGSSGRGRSRWSARLMNELLSAYLSRTRSISDTDPLIAPDNNQVAQQVENVLLAFGRRQPTGLCYSLDELILSANTRLQGLTLLSSFLRQQTPHLYLVINTPLVEHLLQCLMNDTSTTVLSVALTSLIMLLPHIAGSLGPHLPRMFLVYSRLLCWEKFSPLSSEAQKNLVTDDRVGPEGDHGDVGIDPAWEKARPKEGAIESATPELMTYFTYLYGLYPLHLMKYIRKPRRFLKDAEFPGADDFDLDQTVIRNRTDQFRQVHLMHSNFYNLTIEDEIDDPKWSGMDPADVVAECQALNVYQKPSLVSPGPPPTGKLPDVPQLPVLANMRNSPQISPSTSHASFRSGTSWRDTQSTAVSTQQGDGDSPVLRPHADEDSSPFALRPRSKGTNRTSPSLDDFPQPASAGANRSPNREDAPKTNVAYLQQQNTLLRSELNFERWHKSQYAQHIGQLTRKNVKDATQEAEHLNLINANRALKMQLDQVRNAREATNKDSALTRKQVNNIETNLTDRFTQMKKDQETWRADAEELRNVRRECNQYRDLLVAAEARELSKSSHLENVKRELENLQDVDKELNKAREKLRDYEYRDFEMSETKRELEILQHEKDALQMRVQRHQHDHERTRRAYQDKVSELEAQLEDSGPASRRFMTGTPGRETQALVQQAVADGQAKLNHLRKKHTVLMEKYTDLEMEYDAIKAQLDAMQGSNGGNGHTFLYDNDGDAYTYGSPERTMRGALASPSEGGYDNMSDLGAISENAYITSASDPSHRRYQPHIGGLPLSPPASEATLHSAAGLTWKPPVSRQDSMASRGTSSTGAPAVTYNQTAPLSTTETVHSGTKSTFSENSNEAPTKKEKIKPESAVRVYGRGGAQNIKLKNKDKGTGSEASSENSKKSRFGGLKNLV